MRNQGASVNMTFEQALLGVGLSSSFVVGTMLPRRSGGTKFTNIWLLTFVSFAAVATVSLAQFVLAPQLLPLLMRDANRITAGQYWRLWTSLFVQDGGWMGAAFNLTGLVALGAVAERVLGRWLWIAASICSVASAQWAALSWQPLGAGNSILNCGLAGAVCAVAIANRRGSHTPAPAFAALACFTTLLIRHDIHGVAAGAGVLVAFAASLPRRPTAMDRRVE